MKIELFETYTTEEDLNLICYEQTEKYSFLCPYTVTDEESVILDLKETLVYSNNMPDEAPITAIEKLTVIKED